MHSHQLPKLLVTRPSVASPIIVPSSLELFQLGLQTGPLAAVGASAAASWCPGVKQHLAPRGMARAAAPSAILQREWRGREETGGRRDEGPTGWSSRRAKGSSSNVPYVCVVKGDTRCDVISMVSGNKALSYWSLTVRDSNDVFGYQKAWYHWSFSGEQLSF